MTLDTSRLRRIYHRRISQLAAALELRDKLRAEIAAMEERLAELKAERLNADLLVSRNHSRALRANKRLGGGPVMRDAQIERGHEKLAAFAAAMGEIGRDS